MENLFQDHCERKGILSGLKARLEANRLGELLLLKGHITDSQLEFALAVGRNSGRQLGLVLRDHRLVDSLTIHRVLAEQFMLRMMLFILTMLISFAGMGAFNNARAGSIKDVPARVAFQQVAAFAPMGHYPKLFGSSEKESRSLSAFTKWTSMFERFDASLDTGSGQQAMHDLKNRISHLQGQPISRMAAGVNDVVNNIPYVNDSAIYGKTDYWATPMEFMKNGGDCEDFAITKYVSLRALGVPEERMRLVVLQDMQKNIPHAILVVYTENGPLVLDNQIKRAMPIEKISHYKPIFSINRDSWWLHTKPRGNVTVVASSSR